MSISFPISLTQTRGVREKGKGELTFGLDDLYGDVLVSETEQFEVAVTSFTGLGVSVNFDTKVISV